MTFNIWTFLFEIINFVALAYILHRLLYRPLQKAVEERRQANQRQEQETQEARREADTLRREMQTQLAAIEKERQDSIRQAREQATLERKKMLQEAEQVVRRRDEESRQTLERERAEAYQGMRGKIVRQAVDLAGRMLHEAANRNLNGQLAERLVETLQGLPAAEQRRVRANWQATDGAVLEAAAELDATHQARLAAAATTLVGQPVSLTVQTKPMLLGGVRLRLGGEVWDASLAGSLGQACEPESSEIAHNAS